MFDCTAKGSAKHLSVCASDDLKALQYRFGPIGTPELVWPADSNPSSFEAGHQTFASGEGHVLSFVNDGHTYTLSTGYGRGEGWEVLTVAKGEAEIARIECQETGTAAGVNRLSDAVEHLSGD